MIFERGVKIIKLEIITVQSFLKIIESDRDSPNWQRSSRVNSFKLMKEWILFFLRVSIAFVEAPFSLRKTCRKRSPSFSLSSSNSPFSASLI